MYRIDIDVDGASYRQGMFVPERLGEELPRYPRVELGESSSQAGLHDEAEVGWRLVRVPPSPHSHCPPRDLGLVVLQVADKLLIPGQDLDLHTRVSEVKSKYF